MPLNPRLAREKHSNLTVRWPPKDGQPKRAVAQDAVRKTSGAPAAQTDGPDRSRRNAASGARRLFPKTCAFAAASRALTFDMRGGTKAATPLLGRPLDGVVRARMNRPFVVLIVRCHCVLLAGHAADAAPDFSRGRVAPA